MEPIEFKNVMNCNKCTEQTSKKIIRDQVENIPQPGFVGKNYSNTRVVLVGQNPGVCPPAYAKTDAVYTAALRSVRTDPSAEKMNSIYQVLFKAVSGWKVQDYFPLVESGLSLHDIAYFNVVRCRTQGNSAPGKYVVNNCLQHFEQWLSSLSPVAIVFIGKWAYDNAGHIPKGLGIPCDFMNRMRSLNSSERLKNRQRVSRLVRNCVG